MILGVADAGYTVGITALLAAFQGLEGLAAEICSWQGVGYRAWRNTINRETKDRADEA